LKLIRPLILASSSRYRREQLARMQIEFSSSAPDVDERALVDESGLALAQRLAEKKARAVAKLNPGALVIGCDQTMVCNQQTFGKPGNLSAARTMLLAFGNCEAWFHSALALVSDEELQAIEVVSTRVQFRDFGSAEIDRYLALEDALDCAGGFKSEALGIALVSSIESRDPSALIGLPLIALLGMLKPYGLHPLQN